MSTVKAINFQHPSAADPSLTLAADGSMSGALPSPNRNLLYNGAMQVAQRGTSTAGITSGGYYTADRWQMSNTAMGTWTQSVENDAPTGTGFAKSLKMLCTTADASPAADDLVNFQQALEGQDLQRIAKGTASAQQLTLSFWVKSNVTGTYVVELHDTDNTRSVGATYTVSVSGTWERKTVTFPADTTGSLDNDNAASLYARWWLGAGSNRTSGTLNTTWAARVAANIAPGQTNLAAATNNYWQVTGVQLEVGPTATGFEFKSYGQELRECQRYYWAIPTGLYAIGANYLSGQSTFIATWPTPTTMRSAPIFNATTSNVQYIDAGGSATNITSVVTTYSSVNGVTVNANISRTGLGDAAVFYANGVSASAEL